MLALAATLERFLLDHASSALTRDPQTAFRLVLIGPPLDAQRELFNRLTSNGTTDWPCVVAGRTTSIPILLVSYREDIPQPTVLSAKCHWDYAVTVRNSSDRVIILVAPDATDRIPESLANTTEVFGKFNRQTITRWFRDSLWKYLVEQISSNLQLSQDVVVSALREVGRQSAHLSPSIRDQILWKTSDLLLQPSGLPALERLVLASGFPSIGGSGGSVENSIRVLNQLAKLLGNEGITPGLEHLKSTQVIESQGLSTAIDELRLHLLSTAPSGASFQESPAIYYKPEAPLPAWWRQLDQGVLSAALNELAPPSPGRLTLTCENPLTTGHGLTIVGRNPILRVLPPSASSLSSANFFRRVGRESLVAIAPDPTDQLKAIDTGTPSHDRPITYVARAVTYNDGNLRVLSLDTFTCRGLTWVSNADENPVPTRRSRQQSWSQQIILPRSGSSEVKIYHSSGTASVEINRDDNNEGPWNQSVQPNSNETTFVLDIEDGSHYTVRLRDSSATEVASWSVNFAIQEVGDAPPTRYAALVSSHQVAKRLASPRVIDSPLRRIEEAYLSDSGSWKPVLACWPTDDLGALEMSWSDPKLGSIFPQLELARV